MARVCTVNMIPGGVSRVINVSQYDNDYTVAVTLLEGQNDYSIPAGSTIRVEGTKPDGLGFEYDCTYALNVVQMPIKTQMSVVAGQFPIELVVYKDGIRVGSANMILAVEKAPLGEGTDISETVLPDIIDAAEANADRAEEAADSAEEEADRAEEAADRAEEAVEHAAIDLAPVIVTSASGNIASFPDGTDRDATGLTVNIVPSQSGSGTPSPSNVRAISGYTSVDVVRTGKNLANITYGSMMPSVSNGQMVQTSGWSTDFIPVNSSAEYIASMPSGTQSHYILFYKTDKTYLGYVSAWDTSGYRLNQYANWSLTGYIKLRVDGQSGSQFTLQLESGSTVTAYTPYTSTTTTIPLPSSAGTVYGGTLDVVNGTLTVDRACHVFDGSESFTIDNNRFRWSTPSDLKPKLSDSEYLAISSHYESRTANQSYANRNTANYVGISASQNGSGTTGFVFILDNATYPSTKDAATYKTWLAAQYSASTPVTVVWVLSVPQTYTLTPTQIKTLQGYNNIYSPQGSVSVDYRADTRLFIERLTKPTEDDMTANANIASGKFFMVGNNLYLSTTAITAGATIAPGSNCTALSLADALNQINS